MAKDIFLVYNASCFYEIVILSYFLQFTQSEVELCSIDGKAIRTMEGYSVNVDQALKEIDVENIRSFVIPGGNIREINHEEVWSLLQDLKKRNVLIAGICAGVDVLDNAGILQGVRSTHSTEQDVVNDKRIITSRANGYVDFAIEVAKELHLFADENDLKETIDFWKNYKRMQ